MKHKLTMQIILIITCVNISCNSMRTSLNDKSVTYLTVINQLQSNDKKSNKIKLIKNLTNEEVNLTSKSGENFLHEIVSTNDIEIINALLNRGLKVNNPNTYNGRTPLYKTNNPVVVKHLIERGANTNHQDNDGWTPAIYHIDNFEVLRIIIESNTDLSILTKENESILKNVLINVHDRQIQKFLKLLYENNYNLSESDKYGLNSVHWALLNQKPRALEYLIHSNVNKDLETKESFSFVKGDQEFQLKSNSTPNELNKLLIEWIEHETDEIGGEWVAENIQEIQIANLILNENVTYDKAFELTDK